jgi:hypothetical protein
MYARDGKMLGGNSAFAHIGTYEKRATAIDIVIQTVRHNPTRIIARWPAPTTPPCWRRAGPTATLPL